jgi:hypothetical protein
MGTVMSDQIPIDPRRPLGARKKDWRWPWVRGDEYIEQEGTSFWQRLREERGWSREDVWDLTGDLVNPAEQALIEGDYGNGYIWEIDDLIALG